MVDELILDFSNAPPAQGGGQYDYVSPGTYIIQVGKSVIGESRNGRTMITVPFVIAQGKSKGKKLVSYFVPPSDGSGEQFPIQRLNALIVACGFKALKTKVSARELMAKIEGKKCVAEVGDRTLGATEKRPEITISDLVAFYAAKSDEGKAILQKMQGNAQPEAPATEEPAAVEEEETAEPEVKEEAKSEESDGLDELDSLFEE